MIQLLHDAALGFSVALTPANLAYCLIGSLLGTLVGVLPGVGPVATISLLLPFTFGLDPTAAIIMLAGIYYGSQYGGSTTAILMNVPGEASSVMTCIDGYQMARQGKAGQALALAAIGSFVAGCFGTVLVLAFATPLSAIGQLFGPADYFAVALLGLLCSVMLVRGSLLKAFAMIVLGVLLSLVGTDINTSESRGTFGIVNLYGGIEFAVIAMGLFGIVEILRNLESKDTNEVMTGRVRELWPPRDVLIAAAPAIGRGTAVGSLLGLLPGGGTMLSTIAAYMLERKVARHPEQFGRGAPQGVAAPEAANNAAAQTSFIPMLALGIPANAVMALMVGALVMQGLQPGPTTMVKQPGLFWGLICSMFIGNVFLLVLNLPLVNVWARLIATPYKFLFPAILIFCCVGAYSVNNNSFDVGVLAFFSGLGYILHKLGFEPTPLILGVILGPLLDDNFQRAMRISNGKLSTLITDSPITIGVAIAIVVLIVFSARSNVRQNVAAEA